MMQALLPPAVRIDDINSNKLKSDLGKLRWAYYHFSTYFNVSASSLFRCRKNPAVLFQDALHPYDQTVKLLKPFSANSFCRCVDVRDMYHFIVGFFLWDESSDFCVLHPVHLVICNKLCPLLSLSFTYEIWC
jgi:hypothetical protein